MKEKQNRSLKVGIAIFLLVIFGVPNVEAWSNTELDKAKADGVKWIRGDLFDDQSSRDYVNNAKARGIRVMGIIKSDNFKPYLGYWYLCEWKWCYYDWGKEWMNYVKNIVIQNKHWVKDWQCDNELNHGIHNFYTANNKQLRKDIVRMCSQTIREADSSADTIGVNLYYGDGFDNYGDIKLYADLRNSDIRIDILGLDIYRATYSTGKPYQYDDDFIWAHSIWGGNMLMTETGFCTYGARLPEYQSNYIVQTYNTLNPSFQNNYPWYKGTMIYESSDSGVPKWYDTTLQKCEKTFGLLQIDEKTKKSAWDVFVSHNRNCIGFCGLTLH